MRWVRDLCTLQAASMGTPAARQTQLTNFLLCHPIYLQLNCLGPALAACPAAPGLPAAVISWPCLQPDVPASQEVCAAALEQAGTGDDRAGPFAKDFCLTV